VKKLRKERENSVNEEEKKEERSIQDHNLMRRKKVNGDLGKGGWNSTGMDI